MIHSPRDVVDALLLVAAALNQLGIRFYVGGSVASSAHGLPRSTLDADVAAPIEPEQVDDLARLLGSDFLFEPEAARQMIRRRCCFNLIYIPFMLKVDVFPITSAQERIALDRAVLRRLDENDPDSQLPMATPEDIVLLKLNWYRLGSEMSQRQWQDVINVLTVHAATMDRDYLRRWAGDLGLTGLLDRALAESAS